jgi:signal transduction histidine kinase
VDELLNHAPCGFVSFGDDGVITQVNQTLLDLLGYTRSDIAGASIERLFTVGTRIFYQTHFFPLIRLHGRADEIFLLLLNSKNEHVGVLANASRRTVGTRASNDCVFIRVVERQKYEMELLNARRQAEQAQAELEENQKSLMLVNEELEQQAAELQQQAAELEATTEEMQSLNERLEERTVELERSRDEANQANLAKSTFLAIMSHELRTPLNAISGYAQLLEMGVQGPVTETQKQSLSRIQQSQRHLLRLVNEILNLARIESGNVEYDVVHVEARSVVSAILPLVEPQVLQKGITLAVDLGEDTRIACDVEKAQQVLLNLLSNAIKFTPADGTIAISARADEANDGMVVLSVRDTGIGIPSDLIETIFDPFVQIDVSRSRRGEGTGLGLAISRDLAQGMGGSLTATSVEGAGSTFYFRLPAA